MADPRMMPFGFGMLPPLPMAPLDELAAAVPPLQGAYQAPEDMRYVPAGGRRGHQAGFEEALRTVGQEALPLALGPLGRLAGMAPRVSAGAGALFVAPSVATPQAAASEEVRILQQTLQTKGYYRGKVDGVMGPATQEANQRFQADQNEAARVQGEREKTAAEKAETDRQRLAEERTAEQRAAGETRMREMEQNLSPFSRAVRDYSTPLGYVLGIGTGLLTRKGAVAGSNALSASRAARADEMIDQASRRGVPRQVGAVNQFWTGGQRRGLTGEARAPFEVTPSAPLGYRANPAGAPPPASSLYQPPRAIMGNTGTDAAIAGGFTAEAALSAHMASSAREEMAAAQQAVAQDPSELNINRLQAATNKLAIAEGAMRFGLTAGATHLGAGAKMTRTPTRPDVARAEAMQMQLGQRLTPQPAPLSAPRPPRERIPRGQPGAGRFKGDD